jgi:hypothetical protein
MKSIIIHVGPAKTATTTIQNTLAAHRLLLQDYGYFYPETFPASNEGHPSLVWEALRDIGRYMPTVSWADVSWQQVLSQYEMSSATHLIISSEDFSDGTFDGLAFERLKEILSGFVIHVVFGIRDPAAVIRSTWQHSVKWGYGGGEEVLDLNDAAISVLTSRASIQVVPMIKLIGDFLSPNSIHFFTVPAIPDPSILLQRFGDACQFPSELTQVLSREAASSTNLSLSFGRTLMFLECNRALGSQTIANPDEITFCLKARALLIQSAPTQRGEKSKWKFSEEAAASIDAIRTRISAAIETEAVFGDLGDLVAVDPRKGNSVKSSCDSITNQEIGELLAQLSRELTTVYKQQAESTAVVHRKGKLSKHQRVRREISRLLKKLPASIVGL